MMQSRLSCTQCSIKIQAIIAFYPSFDLYFCWSRFWLVWFYCQQQESCLCFNCRGKEYEFQKYLFTRGQQPVLDLSFPSFSSTNFPDQTTILQLDVALCARNQSVHDCRCLSSSCTHSHCYHASESQGILCLAFLDHDCCNDSLHLPTNSHSHWYHAFESLGMLLLSLAFLYHDCCNDSLHLPGKSHSFHHRTIL